MPVVTLPRKQSPGQLWDEPEVGPSSRYRMEEQVYLEYRPCIGWPQFREAYKQTLMEDKSLLDHAESFYQMRQELCVVEEALEHQQRRLQEWGALPLTAESILLSPERADVLFNSPQLD